MMDTQIVHPIGVVWTPKGNYFLLEGPLAPDWERGNERRFLVVPRDDNMDALTYIDGKQHFVRPCPREIVSTNWTIEYDTIAPTFCEKHPEE